MHNLFVLGDGADSTLKDAFLVIDTNFIIDAWLFKEEAADLLAKLDALNCYLMATRSVVIEFLGGTKDADSLTAKLEFLEKLFARPIDRIFVPYKPDFPKHDEFIEFSRQANNFSCTDFELYLTLKKYAGRVMLMTRNHKDFTAPTFERKGFITLLGKKEVHTHGLYVYSPSPRS